VISGISFASSIGKMSSPSPDIHSDIATDTEGAGSADSEDL
jgi:hypothetical protein